LHYELPQQGRQDHRIAYKQTEIMVKEIVIVS